MKTIQYTIDIDSGLVISRVGSYMCVSVLDFVGMLPENDWKMNYKLEMMSCHGGFSDNYRWTKKIPLNWKNLHRRFWGMKPLDDESGIDRQKLKRLLNRAGVPYNPFDSTKQMVKIAEENNISVPRY